MSKDIWKNILEEMPDMELSKLAAACEIKVQGFRQITPNNIQFCKAKLIVEAIKKKTFTKVIQYFNKKKSDVDLYRDMDVEKLILAVNQGTPRYKILASLLSSQEQHLIELANTFIKLSKNPNMERDTRKINKEKLTNEENEQIILLRGIVNDLETKLLNSEEKNKELLATINKLNEKFNNAKTIWNNEKKKILNKISILQNENELNQNTYLKTVEENINKLHEYEEEIKRRNSEISHLNAKILNIKNTKPTTIEKNLKSSESLTYTKQIALIGNPKNKKIEKNKKIKFQIFEESDLDKVLYQKLLNEFEEIWLLTYKVHPTKQKKIHEGVNHNVYEISTFQDLLKNIERIELQ